MEQPQRIDSRVTSPTMFSDELESRFERLGQVLDNWQKQVERMPIRALELFEEEDLLGIMSLMQEQKMLVYRVAQVKEFIVKWQTPTTVSGFLEVARYRDE